MINKKVKIKKNNYFLFKYLKLKNIFSKKRGYKNNFLNEKFDLLFDNYRYSLIKNMFEISTLKKNFIKKNLKKRIFCHKIFKKNLIKGLNERIRNDLLLMSPDLLRLHIKEKSWKFIKIKNRRKLKNVKKMVLRYFPKYRESFILKKQLDSTYFWLINTTKRQILNATKINKLKLTSDIVKNYYFLKNKYFKKNIYFFKNKKKYYNYYLKNVNEMYIKAFNLYFFYLKNINLIIYTKKNFLFKFVFFKYLNILFKKFKRSILFNLLKDSFNISFSEMLSLQKGKLHLRKKFKKKLYFYYNLYMKKKYIYKLKVKMVNSNFFITLTDYNDNVIISRSTGQVSENRKKKVKLSPYLVTKMMYSIINGLKKKKIKFLFFFINSKINRHINNVMKCLKTFRYTKILKVFFSKPIAHHFGTRKPKLRRL